ncbi:MAG: 2-oxo acid dehydrogenase subunit E2 [Spirochaetaceae bacterium]|nr:2-oxo acid dehydrogenase subunit E2 [Spirochaetaceae bacterium]
MRYFLRHRKKIHRKHSIGPDGTVQTRDKVKVTFTYDDRITDGIYCARAIDMVRDLVENPEKLEVPLELTPEEMDRIGLAESELKAE